MSQVQSIMKTLMTQLQNNNPQMASEIKGLLDGTKNPQDIVKQVKNNEKHIMIPSNMLREFTDTFLDGMTVRELEEKLNAKICVNHGGEDLVKKIGEIANEENSVDCHNR